MTNLGRIALTFATSVASLAVAAGLPMPADSTGGYVGTEACRPCHPSAFEIWVSSPHARTALYLSTQTGREMEAREAERERRTGEKFECRRCHEPPGPGVVAKFGPGYHPEDGVQCETCHGPGEEHVIVETAKDTLSGHKIFNPKNGNDFCQICHYEEKPFHVPAELRTPLFDYKTAWKRIAHPTPPGERNRR